MQSIDIAQVPPRQRVEVLHEVIRSNFATVDVTPARSPAQIRFAGHRIELGQLAMHGLSSNGLEVRRTSRMMRDGARPTLALAIQRTGTSLIEQQGRNAALGPGDITAYVTTAPFTLSSAYANRKQVFTIPTDQLALPDDVLHRATALKFDVTSSIVRLVRGFLTNVAAAIDTDERFLGHTVAHPAVELVRAMVTSTFGDDRLARATLNDALHLRIVRYLEAHWSDPDLRPATVAAAHHISVRHLYNALAKAQISLGDWVRDRRLEACRAELASAAGQTKTVAAVGERWGFADPTHFSRVFKGKYGCTPREWRELHKIATVRPVERRELDQAACDELEELSEVSGLCAGPVRVAAVGPGPASERQLGQGRDG